MRSALLVAMLVAAPLLAGEQPLTIERIFSEPPLEGSTPREVRWLPDGRRFSFLEKHGEGKESSSTLYLEDAVTGERQVLFVESEIASFGEGEAKVHPSLAGYQWTPQGNALLLSGDGELFLAELPQKKVRRLTSTSAEEEAAQLSPDGAWVAFVRAGDLWVLELASGKEIRLTQDGSADKINGKLDWVYQEELAGPDTAGFAWSPDSRAIAFLTLDESKVPRFPIVDLLPVHPTTESQLYPKAGDPNPGAALAVVTFMPNLASAASRFEQHWSGENAPYLARLGWSPDGTSVWYEVLNRDQTRLELARLDPTTGGSTSLAVEEDPAWVNVHDDLRFLKDGSFVWSSERSGFRHLYLFDARGQLVWQLTSGDWEVTELERVDEASGWVYFTATEASPLERQLYRVRLDGAGLERITRGPGTHSCIVAPAGELVIDSYSRAMQPPASRLLDISGRVLREVKVGAAPGLDSYSLGTIELLTIPGPAGVPLQASLLKPAGFDPARRYPVVVYVYGGPHAQVVRDAWGGRYTLFHLYLASRGMLVFSLDNRGSAARGREFERALLRRFGKVELEDQLAGVGYLRSLPFVDGERIGIWGWSYGGFLTCYALTNAPGVFAAGAAVAPVTDWRYYDTIYTERYLKLPAENPDGYRDSSPVNQAEKLQAALLLVHGTGDDNVHWQNTLAFTDRLYRAGKPYDLQLYANKNHGIPGKEARIHLHRRIAEHLERFLRR